MKYTIICGSMREQSQSQSFKVSAYLKEQLVGLEGTEEVTIIDLEADPIPAWDPSFWSGDAKWETSWVPKRDILQKSDGIIVVTPEYAGMVSSSVKNFFLFAGGAELGHKPGLIVGVSASRGGSYPVAELRMSSYKNNKLCYIPDHLIIRDAAKVLNSDVGENDVRADKYIRARIAYTLDVLAAYTRNLKTLRTEHGESLLSDQYMYGM